MELLTFKTIDQYLIKASSLLPEAAPSAVCLLSSDNFDGFLNPKTFNISSLIKSAAKTHHLFFVVMENADIKQAVDRLSLGIKKVDLLIIIAHSNEEEIWFSKNPISGVLRLDDVPKLDLSFLSDRVNILFHCCKAGVNFNEKFHEMLPGANIWSSKTRVTDAILFPSSPEDPRLKINIYNLDVNETDYPLSAHKEDGIDWRELHSDLDIVQYKERMEEALLTLNDSPSEEDKENSLSLLRKYARMGDLFALSDLAKYSDSLPEQLSVQYELVSEGFSPTCLGLTLIKMGRKCDGIHYLYEGLFKGDLSEIDRLKLREDFFSKIVESALAKNQFALEIYFNSMNKELFRMIEINEMTKLLIESVLNKFDIKEYAIETLGKKLNFTPHLKILQKHLLINEGCRQLLYLYYQKIKDKSQSDEMLTKGIEFKDGWALYLEAQSYLIKKEFDLAADTFIASNTVRGLRELESLADTNAIAAFFIYTQDTTNEENLYRAAFLDHPKALEIVSTLEGV